LFGFDKEIQVKKKETNEDKKDSEQNEEFK
jgi:hypothetical protein